MNQEYLQKERDGRAFMSRNKREWRFLKHFVTVKLLEEATSEKNNAKIKSMEMKFYYRCVF